MSRRPPRCRRAEANSPTLELTSGTDGPWFDLVITQVYLTGGGIGAPSRWSQRLAWSRRLAALSFFSWVGRATRASPVLARPRQGSHRRGAASRHPCRAVGTLIVARCSSLCP